MKKAVALLLSVLFIFSLVACNNDSDKVKKPSKGNSSVKTEVVSSLPDVTSSEDSKPSSSSQQVVWNNPTNSTSSEQVVSNESVDSSIPVLSFAQTTVAKEDTSKYQNDFFLKRGINLSTEIGVAGKGFAQPRYMELIKKSGFDHVRLPVRFEGEEETTKNIRDVAEDIKKVAKMATDAGLYAIVDVHKVNGINLEPHKHKQRLYDIWTIFADVLKDCNEKVIFEIINEPNSQGNNTFTAEILNDIQNECIRIIRKTNPTRWIAAAVGEMNTVDTVAKLEIPKDDKYIFPTFHCYTPMSFTHQGTSDAYPVGTIWGTKESEYNALKRYIKMMADWGLENNRYIHIGEMGNPIIAGINYRVAWFSYYAKLCDDYDVAWCVWDMNGEFGIFNKETDQFNGVVLNALMRR